MPLFLIENQIAAGTIHSALSLGELTGVPAEGPAERTRAHGFLHYKHPLAIPSAEDKWFYKNSYVSFRWLKEIAEGNRLPQLYYYPLDRVDVLKPLYACAACDRTGDSSWSVRGDYLCAWCRIDADALDNRAY